MQIVRFYNAFYEIPFLSCLINSLVRKDINGHERLSNKHVINQESIELIRFNLIMQMDSICMHPAGISGNKSRTKNLCHKLQSTRGVVWFCGITQLLKSTSRLYDRKEMSVLCLKNDILYPRKRQLVETSNEEHFIMSGRRWLVTWKTFLSQSIEM